MSDKTSILIINMAKGFGGGEFQTEQLMLSLTQKYNIYFLGKKSGIFREKIKKNYPYITVISILEAIKLVLVTSKVIIHAQDGRGAHIAGFLKKISKKPAVITRHVNFPFKHKSSLNSYKNADFLIGVSNQITQNLHKINENTKTIYGCIPQLKENLNFEKNYFANKKIFSIAQIGNLQPIKNHSLTIELARQLPNVQFYIVGSGILEDALKEQARGLNNIVFIPFTSYVGSVFKHIDLHIMPSHSEGLGSVILEGYQYNIPTIAHSVGGIPEIIEHDKTGFLVKENNIIEYKNIITHLINTPSLQEKLKDNIQNYLDKNDFSVERMAKDYHNIYQKMIK